MPFLRKIYLSILKKCKFLPNNLYVKIYYEYYTGKKLNLESPKEFNEKIQWYKVYYRPKILNVLVDKYAVRSYVKKKIGEEYLNDLIKVYDSASKVNFEELPNQFVIKGAHGFHFNLIVKNKKLLNKNKAKFLLHKWMNKNQYYRGGLEWAYKNVPPRLIAEKYLEEIGKEIINDYKFYCFSGTPKFVQVDSERGYSDFRCFYDMEWNLLPFSKGSKNIPKENILKPNNFEEMKTIAGKLADKFPFVRVDLYNINGRILFGEMTFYPGDGRIDFVPDKYNKIIGDYFILPNIPMGQKYIT